MDLVTVSSDSGCGVYLGAACCFSCHALVATRFPVVPVPPDHKMVVARRMLDAVRSFVVPQAEDRWNPALGLSSPCVLS